MTFCVSIYYLCSRLIFKFYITAQPEIIDSLCIRMVQWDYVPSSPTHVSYLFIYVILLYSEINFYGLFRMIFSKIIQSASY